MRKVLLCFALCVFCTRAYGTGQAPERIIIGKDTLALLSVPADSLDPVRFHKFDHVVRASNTIKSTRKEILYRITSCLWRGYVGTWELKNDTLRFHGAVNIDGKPIDLSKVLPSGEPATWFSGELKVGRGKIVEFGDYGFDSQYEYETRYTLRNGVVEAKKEIRNGSIYYFEKDLCKIGNSFEFPDEPDFGQYTHAMVEFTITPTPEGRFERFDSVSLTLWPRDIQSGSSDDSGNFASRLITTDDPTHPYIVELLRRLGALEPFTHYRDDKIQSIRFALYLKPAAK